MDMLSPDGSCGHPAFGAGRPFRHAGAFRRTGAWATQGDMLGRALHARRLRARFLWRGARHCIQALTTGRRWLALPRMRRHY